ncbi:MAG: hypothetical protein OEY59_07735, partial [Deltaproteobacteria bacterium]|nr:hypothetical protein [Deltaproteobacteria bacterium]
FFYFKRDIKNKLEDESTGQKPDMKATANEIFINDALKIMILHGDVVMDHQQENAKFFADRTEIHYNPDNQFKELVATGNFILEQKGRHSSADRAVYDMIKEVVTLLGNAEVREKGQGAVRSSKIVMNIDIAKGILKGEEDIPVRFEIPLD